MPTRTTLPTASTASGTAVPSPTSAIALERLELVSDATSVGGDGGNAWGGHQTRLVRTSHGLFTAYTVPGEDSFHREWRLAQRTDQGWQIVAQGPSGRDPVNLLQGPDETIYLISWPEGLPVIWTSSRRGGELTFTEEAVPGKWERTNWPYPSAGISPRGDLCLLASYLGKPAKFEWACRSAHRGRWTFHVTRMDYRYCYTYVMPAADGSLSLVSTRDVKWEALGYKKPENAFDYAFNAIGLWHTLHLADEPLQRLIVREEAPDDRFLNVFCNAQADAYVDTARRTHILYWVQGPSTGGRKENRHAIVENGCVARDVLLPGATWLYFRLVQDTTGRFYLIGATDYYLLVYPATSEDGLEFGPRTRLHLSGYRIVYSGQAIGAPRGGVPLADYVDGVFPSGEGDRWVYYRVRLRGAVVP